MTNIKGIRFNTIRSNQILLDEEVSLITIKSDLFNIELKENAGELVLSIYDEDVKYHDDYINFELLRIKNTPFLIRTEPNLLKESDQKFIIVGIQEKWESNIILKLKPVQ